MRYVVQMRWKAGLFFLLLLALFLEILIGFPIQLDKPEPEMITADKLNTDQAEKKFEGVHVVETQKGQKDWELFSDKAESYESQSAWKLKVVKVHFFSDNLLQFTVVGDSGEVNTSTKDIEVSGNVVTTSANGYRFQSPTIRYFAKDRRLFTDQSVKMQSPEDDEGQKMEMTGIGMETFVGQKKMHILKNLKAKRFLKDGHELLIQSEQGEFSTLNHRALFLGQVSVAQQEMKMEGPELELLYKKGTNILESLRMNGGVKLSDGQKSATSDQVFFEPEKDRYVLKGRPRVVQAEDEILGDEIVLWDGGRKIQVEKVRAHLEKEDGG